MEAEITRRYHVFRNGNWVGPYEIRDLRMCWALGTLTAGDYIYVEPENQTLRAGSFFEAVPVSGPLRPATERGFNQRVGTYQVNCKRWGHKLTDNFFAIAGAVGGLGAFLLCWKADLILYGYGLMLASILLVVWGGFRIARFPAVAMIIALLAMGAVATRVQLKASLRMQQVKLEKQQSSQTSFIPSSKQTVHYN